MTPARLRAAVPKPGITSSVYRYLDGDSSAQDMLSRGVVSYRAMARWLMVTQNWSTTEEAVVSALRRYPRLREDGAFTKALQILGEAHMNSRSNVASLVLPRRSEVHRKVAALFDLVDPSRGELLRIVESDRAIKVIIAGPNVTRVREAVGEQDILSIIGGLAEFTILCPREAADTPGVLAVILSTLAVHNINVVDSLSSVREHLVIVQESNSLKAYQVLNRLCNKVP